MLSYKTKNKIATWLYWNFYPGWKLWWWLTLPKGK